MAQAQLDNKFRLAYQKILAAKNILVATHFNPDGDALSSICAVIELLEQLNKPYYAFVANEPPSVFSFLPNLEKIRYFSDPPRLSDGGHLDLDWFHQFDLVLILDCGSMNRTRLETFIKERLPDQLLIEIDHHPKVDDYTDLEIRDSHAAATAEMIYRFFKANGVRFDRNMANCILTGLVTDTANFLYPATSELTVQIASEMMALGARLPRIMENVLRNKSLAAMRLWGRVMSNLKINERYNVAITALTNEDINGTEADKEEMDGISGFLSNLYGVNAVLFLREEKPGLLRGNLRTARDGVDLSRLAALLGGGGHAKASGFTIEGRIDKTEHGWKIV